MEEINKVEKLKTEVEDLKRELSVQKQVNELTGVVHTFGCRIESNNQRINKLENSLNDVQKLQREIFERMTSFIAKYKYNLLIWFIGCIISISGLYIMLAKNQEQNIQGLKDDIIKILIHDKMGKPKNEK
jgi:hypothetical protein